MFTNCVYRPVKIMDPLHFPFYSRFPFSYEREASLSIHFEQIHWIEPRIFLSQY